VPLSLRIYEIKTCLKSIFIYQNKEVEEHFGLAGLMAPNIACFASKFVFLATTLLKLLNYYRAMTFQRLQEFKT